MTISVLMIVGLQETNKPREWKLECFCYYNKNSF